MKFTTALILFSSFLSIRAAPAFDASPFLTSRDDKNCNVYRCGWCHWYYNFQPDQCLEDFPDGTEKWLHCNACDDQSYCQGSCIPASAWLDDVIVAETAA